MGNYTIYREFTAHGPAVQALGLMYKRLAGGSLEMEEVMPLIVFIAFSIEAYVNHLGHALPGWKERRQWKKKIEHLHEAGGQTCNWSSPPLDFAEEVFSIRDRLAHGKPHRIEINFSADADDASNYLHHPDLTPYWFRTCLDLEWAIQSKPRFLTLTDHLGALFGHSPHHIMSASETRFDRANSGSAVPADALFEMNLSSVFLPSNH